MTIDLLIPTCKICRNSLGNKTHIAREMLLGLRDQFAYLECARCGCVQLLDAPSDMSRYYPSNYYSYQPHGRLKTVLRQRWSAHAFGQKSLFGSLAAKLFFPNRALMAVSRLKPLSDETRILDIGCGVGELLLDLWTLGFRCLTGVDPFISRTLTYDHGLTIHKKQLAEMSGEFDLIMLHHSFEHMDQPAEVMRTLAGLLASTGTIILRIPVASTFPWRHYGVNWFGLDAPRHLYLHTLKSIELITRPAGLFVTRVIHETDERMFFACESYMKGIAASDPQFPDLGFFDRLRRWKEVRVYRQRAADLNRKQDSDSVCIYLSKSKSEST